MILNLPRTRANDPPVPLFIFVKEGWEFVKLGVGMLRMVDQDI